MARVRYSLTWRRMLYSNCCWDYRRNDVQRSMYEVFYTLLWTRCLRTLLYIFVVFVTPICRIHQPIFRSRRVCQCDYATAIRAVGWVCHRTTGSVCVSPYCYDNCWGRWGLWKELPRYICAQILVAWIFSIIQTIRLPAGCPCLFGLNICSQVILGSLTQICN